MSDLPLVDPSQEEKSDSTKHRYPPQKIQVDNYEDLIKKPPAGLRDPDNVKTVIEYDIRTGTYLVRTRLGEMDLVTPFSLTPEEYATYSLQQSMRQYFYDRNNESHDPETKVKQSPTDFRFQSGLADRLFGPGGIRVRAQGSVDIAMGLKHSRTNNPTLSERSRSRTIFNFDENVQLNVQASVGTKINFGMNYNTESSFDFDQKQLSLTYTGEEDEIIKSIQAGNVSMTTGNSLIRGGTALFGLKSELQFGKLRVNTLFAQQNSESRTISSKGGSQTNDFEIPIDQYDESRHFFLSHYFRDRYDEAMERLPYIKSEVSITRIEVWVTNRQRNYDHARNLVAFSDLAEGNPDRINNPTIVTSLGGKSHPHNHSNNLYELLQTTYRDARDMERVTQVLSDFKGTSDYEKIESARLLTESEYIYERSLGYISLRTQLLPDEALAVAYEYTIGGKTYQVGEFSTDSKSETEEGSGAQANLDTRKNLYVKLLKGKSISPNMPFWDLMMKNIYSLNAYGVQKEQFRLNILFQSDTVGTYINHLPEGKIRDQLLLRVMNLDNLDTQNEPNPDGFFDFLEGKTIQAEAGRIVFPVVEPFGSHLKKKIGQVELSEKYVYQELYDSTLTYARQMADKNKYILRGEYRASSNAEIDLGMMNVARGSVMVRSNGQLLTEGVDYAVDYLSGKVSLLNENLRDANIDVSLEGQSLFNMQRKTLFGLDLNYQFNPRLNVGATIMHLSEMPLTTKVGFGDESVRNTLWGVNLSYKTESQWLTNMLDKVPLLDLTQPSQISFNAEFAHLIAGHYKDKENGDYSYVDDFESVQSGFDLMNPYPWQLSSVPYDDSPNPLFPEASLMNDLNYGKNRSLLAWYYVDGLFTRKSSSLRPGYLNADSLSNHYVRAIGYNELFPNRDQSYHESSFVQALNVAYYPKERGPYNLDADYMNPDFTLQKPEQRFGGMMRRMDQTDFETANIEYIEFWLLDPYIYNENHAGGDLYFNLGDLSEDILKDGKKFFENGLPIDGNLNDVDITVWGKVPKRQSAVYAFDNTSGARKMQDVGLNGLSSEEERVFPGYAEYIEKLGNKLSPATIERMEEDPLQLSPFHNPSGDKYHFYRGKDLDGARTSILDRYKRYNGTQGNSVAIEDSDENYNTAAKSLPDVEDLNQDNTLDEAERYFEYKVSLRPEDLQEVGQNNIANIREVEVFLENGKRDTVVWYQFKVPVRQPDRAIGGIRDYKSIRYMRMYMTGFKEEAVLRFGTFKLTRADWRSYTKNLQRSLSTPSSPGTIEVSSVNVEEDSDRKPVNYVLPPRVSRMLTPGQPQLHQQNEQAMSMKITDLGAGDARAVYKSISYDFRRFKRLQMFIHAESLMDNITDLKNDELTAFIRLGSDYNNNYYEYEIPLSLTKHGRYLDTPVDQRRVWPEENQLDFAFEALTRLKLERNQVIQQNSNLAGFDRLYTKNDPERSTNKISVIGNPSLADIKVIMIGVRNTSKEIKSGEVWVNELRLTDFDDKGGWAANANLNVQFSDLGSVNLAGHIETAGFGSLDQSIGERRMDDFKQYSISTNIELGKFFPSKAQVSIPLFYSYAKETTTPEYNPFDTDIKMSDALKASKSPALKDSLKTHAVGRVTSKSFALNNVKVGIKSKTPMPYDPINFTFSYSYNVNRMNNPETEYETRQDWRGSFGYNYSPYAKPFTPFSKRKQEDGASAYLKQLSFHYFPANVFFQTSMVRNYYEVQLRHLGSYDQGAKVAASFSQNWTWNRSFGLTWNLTNNLSFSFQAGTNSRIEEPHVQVNKKLNPDEYQVWRDSVKQSIRDLGKPMFYDQTFNATFTFPFQYIPALNWVTGSATYNAVYNWERGAQLRRDTTSLDNTIGNVITNQRNVDIQGNFNLVALYNKNPYLRSVNQKFNQGVRKRKKNAAVEQRGGETVSGESIWTEIKDYSVRFLMMVRRLNIQYRLTDGMTVPGFLPEIGDWIGQGSTTNGQAPGFGFAFGAVNRSFIDKAKQKDWLVISDYNVNPAMMNSTKTFTARMTLEPLKGLRIDLNANRVDTRNRDVYYMYDQMPDKLGGSFLQTTVALSSTFKGIGSAKNGYKSEVFERFLSNRRVIAERVRAQYRGKTYPTEGFITETTLGGKNFSSDHGDVDLNSADVLIPAFLAAYTNKKADKISLSFFPSLSAILPNWRATYEGLNSLSFIQRYFKSFILNHAYSCTYRVGSFSSFSNWVSADGSDLGYIRDVLNGHPIPSSPYEVFSVSLNEAFAPLIGVDVVLHNNITGTLKFQRTRNLNLNISSVQLVESLSNEFVIGVGYQLADFNKLFNVRKKGDFSNDLTIRMDLSHRKTQTLIRRITEESTQATSGNIAKTIQLSADYALSRMLTLRAFYDMQINEPLISSSAYPTTNSNYGISLRVSLTQ